MKSKFGNFIDEHPWQTGVIIILFLVVVIGMYGTTLPDAVALKSSPAGLAQRQIQAYCVAGEEQASGQDICDIGHFDSISQNVVHFRAPDPLSARLQGDFREHCATFTDIPSYVSVVSLNTDTMQMEPVNDNSSIYTCEAFFTLTDS